MPAPIALFVYKRLDHTIRTVTALSENVLANESDLIIYSDAPRTPDDAASVQAVRDYIKTINGFKSVTIEERIKNYGLSKSVLDGVTNVIRQFGKVIVMEEDLVSSKYFLKYMNRALEKFEHEEKIISIHGYMYPVRDTLPEIFFLRGADCWGWATWKRGWDLLERDGAALKRKIESADAVYRFNFYNSYPFFEMLEGQIEGRNDSWAILWHASAFVNQKLTVYPGKSLVHNIGNDNSGTHNANTDHYNVTLSLTEINLDRENAELTDNLTAVSAIASYFFETHSKFGILKSFVKKYLWRN